jgi:CheY-like chemotaxis protein
MGLAGLRVLVADDSEINLEVARQFLEAEGAGVQVFADGQSAIDWLAAHPGAIDLVLMDVKMPGIDGLEAARRIRALDGCERLPIVAVTAAVFDAEQDAARRAGMDDFIGKPFNMQAMMAMIRRLTGRADGPATPATTPDRAAGVAAAVEARYASTPGVDIARALRVWRDVERYCAFLSKFAAGYAGTAQAISARLVAGQRDEARAIAHGLAGAAGSMALSDTSRLASEVERTLSNGGDASELVQALDAALATALDSIARMTATTSIAAPGPAAHETHETHEMHEAHEAPGAPGDPAIAVPSFAGPVGTTIGALVDATVAGLLAELLAALDGDNPGPAEPLLAALAAKLPVARVAPLQQRVDRFDFRGAEREVRLLAASLGLPLNA